MTACRNKRANADKELLKLEDQIFGAFCKKLKIKSIREYEEMSIRDRQTVSSKRMEYVAAKAKLENMIRFDTKRLADTAEREARLQAKLDLLNTNNKKIAKKISIFQAQLEKLTNEKSKLEKEFAESNNLTSEKGEVVNKLRKEYQDLANSQEAHQKEVAQYQAEIAMNIAERINLIRKCKLEEVLIPLSNGGTIADIDFEALQVILPNVANWW